MSAPAPPLPLNTHALDQSQLDGRFQRMTPPPHTHTHTHTHTRTHTHAHTHTRTQTRTRTPGAGGHVHQARLRRQRVRHHHAAGVELGGRGWAGGSNASVELGSRPEVAELAGQLGGAFRGHTWALLGGCPARSRRLQGGRFGGLSFGFQLSERWGGGHHGVSRARGFFDDEHKQGGSGVGRGSGCGCLLRWEEPDDPGH